MFDFTSSKLLILGIVALLVIGPKELPGLLRTLGKYMGIIRKHANEFRAQFDEAMRDSELEALKKEVETIGKDTEATIRSAEQTVQSEVDRGPRQRRHGHGRSGPEVRGRRQCAHGCRHAGRALVAGGERRRCSGRDSAAQRCGPPARAGAARSRRRGQPAHAPDKTGA